MRFKVEEWRKETPIWQAGIGVTELIKKWMNQSLQLQEKKELFCQNYTKEENIDRKKKIQMPMYSTVENPIIQNDMHQLTRHMHAAYQNYPASAHACKDTETSLLNENRKESKCFGKSQIKIWRSEKKILVKVSVWKLYTHSSASKIRRVLQ